MILVSEIDILSFVPGLAVYTREVYRKYILFCFFLFFLTSLNQLYIQVLK